MVRQVGLPVAREKRATRLLGYLPQRHDRREERDDLARFCDRGLLDGRVAAIDNSARRPLFCGDPTD